MKIYQILSVVFALTLAGNAQAGWSVLVSPDELAEMVAEEEAVVLDIRRPAAYADGHVETAVNTPYAAFRGPDDNPGAVPSDEKLTQILAQAGVEPDFPVVITHAGRGPLDFAAAARVYWTLKSVGVEEAAILNGGLAAWQQAGHALSADEASNFPSDAAFSVQETWRIDRASVARIIDGDGPAVLVDARAPALFRGEEKVDIVPVAGTLSGARNIDHHGWFDGGEMAVSPDQVQQVLAAVGLSADAAIVSFCNTGHMAATNWFVLTQIAGIKDVRLYPEGLAGWSGMIGPLASR